MPNHTPPVEPKVVTDFLRAIGELTVVAAQFDFIAYLAFLSYAQLPAHAAPILTDGVKPQRLLEDAAKLAKALGETKRATALKELTVFLGECIAERNKIIHWFWDMRDDGWNVAAHPKFPNKNLSGYKIENVQVLTEKFVFLQRCVAAHCVPDAEIRRQRLKEGLNGPALWPAPWLDKPSPPDPKRSKTRANRQ